jgi:hypothetical protein
VNVPEPLPVDPVALWLPPSEFPEFGGVALEPPEWKRGKAGMPPEPALSVADVAGAPKPTPPDGEDELALDAWPAP